MNIYYDVEDNHYRTYPDGDIASIDQMRELIENKNVSIVKLQQENQQLKDLYVRTCNHLFNIGEDELARYFQAQIGECNVFTPQEIGKKDV